MPRGRSLLAGTGSPPRCRLPKRHSQGETSMKTPFRPPWASLGGRKSVPAAVPGASLEAKAAGGFVIVAGDGAARWSGRSYGALSRTGFMRNPIAHRAVRMVAEAAASAPWLAYDGERELAGHAVLALLAQPNGRQAGPDFFE